MAIYPKANYRPVIMKGRKALVNPDGACLHTAVTNAPSLFGYFNVGGNPDSHFYLRPDYKWEQYVDTKYQSFANLRGNDRLITVETWDGFGVLWKNGHAVPGWDAQALVAIAELLTWVYDTHKTIPLRLSTTSKRDSSGRGLSYHRLGVPAAWAQNTLGRSQTGGELWSRAVGKICPGDKRISQIPGIFATLQGKPTPPPTPAPKPTPKPAVKSWPDVLLLVDGVFGYNSKLALQNLLLDIGYYGGWLDGDFGRVSVRALQTWLRERGERKHKVDGSWGKYTTLSFQRFLKKRGFYTGYLDGVLGVHTIRAIQTYINSQAPYFR